jgi:DNA-binding MarR family transcriptional regulator
MELVMLAEELTNQVYSFICAYTQQYGLPPTYAKIAEDLDITMSNVRRCLDILEARGKIYREFNSKPAIRLISNGSKET